MKHFNTLELHLPPHAMISNKETELPYPQKRKTLEQKILSECKKISDQVFFHPEKKYLVVQNKHERLFRTIPFANISHIQSNGDYVFIHYGTERVMILALMKQMATKLRTENFRRAHRSVIVNMEYVETRYLFTLYLKDKITNKKFHIPIGRTYTKDFKKVQTLRTRTRR